MPVSVPFKFVPPEQENLVKLHIFEAVAANGPYNEIEVVTAVGTYPDYIDNYTTNLATSATDWFSLQWEDDKGALGEMSAPVKGGEDTLVGLVVDRARERDRSLDIRILTQEAEAAIEGYYGTTVNVYDPALAIGASYRVLNGLTYLTMARSYIVSQALNASGNVESATMGLISFRSGSSPAASIKQDIEGLIALANKDLGISTSYVMLIEDIEAVTYPTYDHSRLVSGYVTIDS